MTLTHQHEPQAMEAPQPSHLLMVQSYLDEAEHAGERLSRRLGGLAALASNELASLLAADFQAMHAGIRNALANALEAEEHTRQQIDGLQMRSQAERTERDHVINNLTHMLQTALDDVRKRHAKSRRPMPEWTANIQAAILDAAPYAAWMKAQAEAQAE